MKCKLVDVFSKQKFCGNGLTIFYDFDFLTTEEMLGLTQEMRQFESIFVTAGKTDYSFRARVFTLQEELDFAGHPVLGLAAHLHEEYGHADFHEWVIELNEQDVVVKTQKTESYFRVTMDQGEPLYLTQIESVDVDEIIAALNLTTENLSAYPLEVISTGLAYLIVPLVSGLEKARIMTHDFAALLSRHQAQFVYVLDVYTFEGRTWDNYGIVEDIATGSAAGPSAAFLYKHQLINSDCTVKISQGRLVDRPSDMEVLIKQKNSQICNIWVSGHVSKVAEMNFV